MLPMQAYPSAARDRREAAARLPGRRAADASGRQTPAQDLADALDNIFDHPNVGPFIAKQLIRARHEQSHARTTSRASRGLRQRRHGHARRPGAVVRAILLDPEARDPPGQRPLGKVKEPMLRLTQLWRAYDAKAQNGRYDLREARHDLGQAPLMSPSVFNFFTPTYAPPGEIRDRRSVRARAADRDRVPEHDGTN